MSDTKKKPKIVIVVGPTASGKTGLAIELAKRFSGEIISADSRQVYRGLDIGTAKVTPEEMDSVPHHLLDVADVDQVYNASDFKRDAAAAIVDITEREKLPIIAGGTFFYVDTLLGKVSLPEVPPNEALRAELESKDLETLANLLKDLDPTRYENIERTNKRRLIRAIEVATALGKVPGEAAAEEIPYDVLTIGIKTDREILRERFKARARNWLRDGIVDEVRGLLAKGVTRERLKEIGFEYTLTLALIDGYLTEEEFIQKSIEKNWQYAKRQLTWLKRDDSIRWFLKDDPKVLKEIEGFLAK